LADGQSTGNLGNCKGRAVGQVSDNIVVAPTWFT
jgi:hypothetical protein